MKSWKHELDNRPYVSGDTETLRGLELFYREGPEGFYVELDSAETDFRVITSSRHVTESVFAVLGDWQSIGLRNYQEVLENSELMYPEGDPGEMPVTGFVNDEVEEELTEIAEKILG